jgi:hypothetical protein
MIGEEGGKEIDQVGECVLANVVGVKYGVRE